MEKNFLLVLFYSASGSVKNLAHAIADGAENESMNIKIRTVPKVSPSIEKSDSDIKILFVDFKLLSFLKGCNQQSTILSILLSF